MKTFRTALKVIAIAAIAAAMTVSGIEKDGKRIFVGSFSGDHIRCALAAVMWVCVTLLLVMFLKRKPEENERPGKGRKVLAVIAALFDVGLTLILVNMLIFAKMRAPERIKSPDGSHYIVRVRTSTLFGHTKYNFYVKDKGVVYRYIFDNDEPDPELEWKSGGVEYRGKLYKY